MNVRLLFEDCDLDAKAPLPPGGSDLTQDLGLDTVFDAMAGGDAFLRSVAERGVLRSLTDPVAIRRRRDAMGDARRHTPVVRELYAVAGSVLATERNSWSFGSSADSVLYRSLRRLEAYVEGLERLRSITDRSGGGFVSAAFVRFFRSVHDELNAQYLGQLRGHLKELRFDGGIWISARLGAGHRGTEHLLRRPRAARLGWWHRLFSSRATPFAFDIGDRDEAGARALGELRERGIASVAGALGRSTDHLRAFFTALSVELAFFLGCLNLEAALAARGRPMAVPEPDAPEVRAAEGTGLYDPGLALRSGAPIVANDLVADGASLIVVTGANQGGKSTFLRSVGIAQLLMQAGMAVPAERFRASVAPTIVTHFARGEDATMTRGRLDDELRRMSQLAERLRAGSLLLSNESFSSTNEREGAALAGAVFRACRESGVRVVAVTHLYELAHSLEREAGPDTLLLRAERAPDGRRTFRVRAGAPLPTSFGADVYASVFGAPPRGRAA